MSTPTAPTPPEAALIRLAREAKNISPETAASRMPFQFSGSSWRQIEAGYRGRARKKVKGKSAIIAHMAHVVGVTPERLAEAGRDDAAEILREIERQDSEQHQAEAVGLGEQMRRVQALMARVRDYAAADRTPGDEVLDELEREVQALRRLKREAGPRGEEHRRRAG